MNLLWPFRRPAAVERQEPHLPPPPAAPPEQRDAASLAINLGGVGYAGGAPAHLSTASAENLSTVAACIGAIASALASVPARVYRATENGRVELPHHPLARLIQVGPNSTQTWPDWVEWMFASALLHGNAVSLIEFDDAGQLTRLRPIPWGYCSIALLPSGRLAYDIAGPDGSWGGTGETQRFLDDEVLHLRDRSDGGLVGRSRLSRSPAVLDAALGLQSYAGAIWRNNAMPAGALRHPGRLNVDARTHLRQEFNSIHEGAANARRVAVLDEGMSFEAFASSPEDSETLESRRFTVAELCRLYQVPPQIVQSLESNSFTSAETAAKWFAQLSLTPWARKLEAAFAKAVLSGEPGTHLEIDLSGLMRGDYSARWASYATAVQNKILTPNEIRELEGFNPLPNQTVPNAEGE